ncbi:MAG: hypothetical protein AB1512_22050 [Thermodesulfobacteriota bacterium]
MNIYLRLTGEFNSGQLRAILAGGQAVVLHRVALMSKDGDWILREDQQTMGHVLSVLGGYGARYRFGAPLDVRWLSGGWSAHLEFHWEGLRVRTDFLTRPPRLTEEALMRMWEEAERRDSSFAGVRDLAEMKKTNREKDYVVIGELARRMVDPDDQILYSRSARDLIRLGEEHPQRLRQLAGRRPVLEYVKQGRVALEAALDRERRDSIRANEERLARYMEAAKPWADAWLDILRQMEGLTLPEAHGMMVRRAENLLPFVVTGGLG